MFDLENDESEEHDLAEEEPELLEDLKVQFNTLLRTHPIYENEIIGEDACPDGATLVKKVGYGATELECGCWVAMHVYNLFDGPYQDLPQELIDFGFDREAAHDHPKGGDDDSTIDTVETIDGVTIREDSSEAVPQQFTPNKNEQNEEEEKDYSSRFDHPKVVGKTEEVEAQDVDERDYSDRFEHEKVQFDLEAQDVGERDYSDRFEHEQIQYELEMEQMEQMEQEFVLNGDVSRNMMRQQKEIRYGNVYIVIVAMSMVVLMLYAMHREKSKRLRSESTAATPKIVSYGAVNQGTA